MMGLAETLAIHSIEAFLSAEEHSSLCLLLADYLTPEVRERFGPARVDSIHEVPGVRTDEIVSVFEPCGRIEVTVLPIEVGRILQGATARWLPEIQRVFPSANAYRDWIYLEYGTGQHITPHADGIAMSPEVRPRQVAAASISLRKPERGGDFFIETSSASERWERDATHGGFAAGMQFIREGNDNSSDWFRKRRSTRWTTSPAEGTMLLWGSQLVHGSEPVSAGSAARLLTVFIEE